MPSDPTPARPLRFEEVSSWDIVTDIAIVGFGAAGSCAAQEARAAGASVDVFELAAAGGGSAALSGGEVYVGGSGGTCIQRAHGFSDTTEDLYRYLMMSAGPLADSERARCYAENAESHFRWLQARGVPFKGSYLPGKWIEPPTDDTLLWSGNEQAWPFSAHATPAPRGHTVQFKGWGGGKLLMEILCGRALEAGARIHYNSRALTLILDREAGIRGLAVRIDGQIRRIHARRGVILCAGGFIANHDMLARHAPAALACEHKVTSGNDDGSGIRMGMAVGAASIHMDQFFATIPFFPPESLVKGIFVNERGERFINEDVYHGRAGHYVLRQPNRRAWLLVDHEIIARPLLQPDVPIAATGDNWEEVEAELSLPTGALVRTVEEFNRHAEQGHDPYFHKAAPWLRPLTQAPFAALGYCIGDIQGHAFTLGGLATKPSGEVLNVDGQIIPGLYAAGRTACGLPRWGEGYSSGLSLGDSTFFGRQAGRHAAGVMDPA